MVAQFFTNGSRSMTTNAVGVWSTARRKRYHQDIGILRKARGGTSLRSIATRPQPPPWTSRSAAFSDSSTPWQRTQSRRVRSAFAVEAENGSKESVASTRAQNSPAAVARARNEVRNVVLPDVDGP